ncbi:MAG: anti-sigma factor [Burkholderiales bacterium]|nr:MAG: anti-sigma factor [Burkholderiales bacterium]
MSKSPSPAPIVEEELHAFVDDALEADRRREVQEYLDRNPEAAATVADLASQRQMLRSALAHIADEPIPEGLQMSMLIAHRRKPSPWAWQMAAAVVLALGTGGFGGWQMHSAVGPSGSGVMALAGEARTSFTAYVSEPVAETGKNELVSLVSNKLKRPISIPDLSQSGYHYAGGKLVATGHGPAGLFFYDRVDGTRMAVMVRPMAADREAPMMEQSAGAVGGFTWAQRGLGYSVVGTEDLDLLHPVANEVRRQAKLQSST